MKDFRSMDEALNILMSKYGPNQLWIECDKCGEKMRGGLSSHVCKQESVDLIKLYSKDQDKGE